MNPRITLVTPGVDDLDKSTRLSRDGIVLPMQARDHGNDVAFVPLEGT